MIRSTHAPLGVPVPTTTNFIPPITDPMGRHWRQPDTSNFVIDDTHVILLRCEFDQLAEYSTAMPSGVYAGKCWKGERSEMLTVNGKRMPHWTGTWYLRWFGLCEDPNACSNNQREIIIID